MSRAYVPVRQDVRKMRYIEWLTTPPSARDPRTEALLAKELDVFPKTLFNWRKDREFNEVWRGETDEVIGGDDKRQAVMDTLYYAATNSNNPRHVAAAKLYLDAINAISPPKQEGQVAVKALGLLTDDELDKLLSRGIAEMQDDGATG